MAEAQEFFNEGNEAFVDDDFTLAIENYSKALGLDSENPDYHLKRALAYYKLDMQQEALNDVDKCLSFKKENVKALTRKGVILFDMGRFNESLESFLSIEKSGPIETINTWIRKCESEIDLAKKAKSDVITFGVCNLNIPEKKNPKSVSNQSECSQSKPSNLTITAAKKKYDWYQNDSYVIITVLIKNVKKEDLVIRFDESTLSMSVKLGAGAEFALDLELAHTIVPKESIYKILSTKIEVKLKKKDFIRWSSLETDNESGLSSLLTNQPKEVTEAKAIASTAQPHTYPTSSKSYKDWDKLATDIEKEDKEQEKEGDGALNSLFKQIYGDGSDEVKKAMNKSFQESGGTVLSTNWKEIGEKKVDVKPPDCMEYKPYEY